MRTSRGVDRGSVAMWRLRDDQPVSAGLISQLRLIRAIIRLYARVVDQSCLRGIVQVVATRRIVGIRIFSIVVSLGFLSGRCHECERLQLGGLVLR